jgi:hypothetical protein
LAGDEGVSFQESQRGCCESEARPPLATTTAGPSGTALTVRAFRDMQGRDGAAKRDVDRAAGGRARQGTTGDGAIAM